MAVTILHKTTRKLSDGRIEVGGVGAFTGTNLTGELPCELALIEGFQITPIGTVDSAGVVGTATQIIKQSVVVELGDITATKVVTAQVPSMDGTILLMSQEFVTKTAIAAHDTNFWTFGAINKSDTDKVLFDAADAANSTKITGGSAITGYAARAVTINEAEETGPGLGIEVVAGDVLEIAITKAASATTMAQSSLALNFKATDTFDVATTAGNETLFLDETWPASGALARPADGLLDIGRAAASATSGLKFTFRYFGW